MVFECLHVYEDSPMGRMAADSFHSEKSKAVCVGDALSGIRVEKIIFHTAIIPENVEWVRITCLGRVAVPSHG